MGHHYRLFVDTKQQYREIFQRAKNSLEAHLSAIRQEYACPTCDPKPALEDNNDAIASWLKKLHPGCGYRPWQERALAVIEQEAGRDILLKLQQIEAYKNTFSCHMCGMCCRMASSEHSYDELRTRAEAGDEFARQFTAIFLPYQSREAARRKAPDVVSAVLAEAGEEVGEAERVYFYHCPYIGEDNRCSIYGTEKRPAICASYPETPLSFVYEKCAWRPWKDETHTDTLAAHALLALCTHWAETLHKALA
jgi:Fe-S-cluster containining protein